MLLEGVLFMRRVSFRVRDFDKEKFLTFNIDNEASLDEEVLDFLEDEEPKGIVPVIFEEDEDFDTFSYNITDKIRLNELSAQEINAEMVLKVLRGLVLALIDMAEYRIPLSYLVLNRNYIYVDSDYRVDFICIPLEEMQEDADVNGFLRNFLASLRFDSSENGDYVAKLLSYVNNPAIFNLRNLVALIEGFMLDMDIDIPEEDSAEIYAEYQEVEEEPEVAVEEAGASFEESQETFKEEQDLFDDTVTVFGGYDKEVTAEEYRETMEESGQKAVEEMVAEEEPEFVGETVMEEEPEYAKESVLEEAEPVRETVTEAESELIRESVAEAEIEPIGEMVAEDEPKDPEESVEEDEPEPIRESVMAEAKELIKKTILEKVLQQSAEKEVDNLEADEPEKIQDGVLVQEDSIEETVEKEGKLKTKNVVTGVVIEDDFDDFMAEKELEDHMLHSEDTGLKIKKNIKINRASVMQSAKDELKEAPEKELEESESLEQEEKEAEKEVEEKTAEEKTEPKAKKGKNAKPKAVPKIKPYLIRVNTKERIMITKQNFKIGKSGIGVDYTVEGNGAVSRVHAVITHKAGEYYIKDNKSTNHTYVNGEMVPDGENEPLLHDSTIVLGDEEFVFKFH